MTKEDKPASLSSGLIAKKGRGESAPPPDLPQRSLAVTIDAPPVPPHLPPPGSGVMAAFGGGALSADGGQGGEAFAARLKTAAEAGASNTPADGKGKAPHSPTQSDTSADGKAPKSEAGASDSSADKAKPGQSPESPFLGIDIGDLDPDHAARWREYGKRKGLAGADLLRAMLSAAVPPEADEPPADPFVSLSLKIRTTMKDEWDELAYRTKRKGPALLRACIDSFKKEKGWPPKP